MQRFKEFNDILEQVSKSVLMLLITVFIIVVSTEVISRNIIKKGILWSQEVSVIAFVWMVFIGAALGFRYRRHYVVDIIPPKYVKTNLVLDIGADTLSFVLVYVLIVSGYNFTRLGMARYTHSLEIRQGFIYGVIPFSGMLMLLFNAEQFFTNISALWANIKLNKTKEEDA